MRDIERELQREIIALLVKHEGPSAAFERAAEFFHEATGMMAIGKDDVSQSHTYEQRSVTWQAWRKEMGV
jgi:hypothetical protein